MAKSNLHLVAPDSELRTVTLRRRSNRDMGRDREHLTDHEVERLIKVGGNRYGQRDATMILIGFRHGLEKTDIGSCRCTRPRARERNRAATGQILLRYTPAGRGRCLACPEVLHAPHAPA